MKIFIVPSWYPSRLQPAAGTFFADSAQILTAAGLDVAVIASVMHSFRQVLQARRQSTATGAPMLETGVRTYRQEYINRWPLREQASFRYFKHRLVRQFDAAVAREGTPDAVLIHASVVAGAALAPRLAEMGIPFAVVEHHKELLIPGGFPPFPAQLVAATYDHARKVVAVSAALESRIRAEFPAAADKLLVIHNPVPAAYDTLELSAPATGPFRFVAVALQRPEKRLDLLLDAFAQLATGDAEVRLTLVGGGPLLAALQSQAARLGIAGQVEFVDYIPGGQLPAEIARHHCLVLSSELETFGLVLVEAMACGRPVIATRCGGPEEIVTEQTGVLAPVNDPAALTAAMQMLKSGYTRYDAAEIRKYAMDRFGRQRYVAEMTALFEELVSAQ